MADSRVVKTSMTLPQKSLDTLRKMAEEAGSSMAEVVRKAVATEEFLRENSARGNKILIKDRDSDVLRELVLR